MNKIIHYCWFGEKSIPENDKKYIEQWKRLMPDFQFILWNEENFDINICNFVKQAYKNKQFAFVSDYVRMFALFKYGGIYLDTDYELLKPLHKFLNCKVLLGWENHRYVGSALIGGEEGHLLFKAMLDYYNSHDFVLSDGSMNTIPNTMILTDYLEEKGIKRGIETETDDIRIFNRTVFFPKKLKRSNGMEFIIDKTTVGIHHFNGSWWSEKERKRSNSKLWNAFLKPILLQGKNFLIKVIGKEHARKIEAKIKRLLK